MLMTLLAAAGLAWSPPVAFEGFEGLGLAPRTAIAADGHHYTAWRDEHGALLASADGRSPVRITRAASYYATAAATGRVAVAYSNDRGAYIKVRGQRTRKLVSRGAEDLALAADPRGGWVFAATARDGVRALSLDRRGRVLARQRLGRGALWAGTRQNRLLAVTPSGRAVLVFAHPSDRIFVSERPHGGRWSAPAPVPGQTEERYEEASVVAAGERVAIGGLRPTSCGDVGCSGFPLLGGLTEPLAGPDVSRPNRVFAPSVAPGVLVYQQKTKVKSFSRRAPVWANGQRLTAAPATEPTALPLGDRTLVLWNTARGWGAALAAAGGRFKATLAPPGPPPPKFHSAETDRDLHTAGRYAIAAWAAEGLVHISVRKFPAGARAGDTRRGGRAARRARRAAATHDPDPDGQPAG